MATKKVIIHTDQQRGQIFRVSSSGSKYIVYAVDSGVFFDDSRKVGEARSMDDAIEIAKSFARGNVRNIEIKDA